MALPTEYEALVRKHEKASVALKNAAKKKKTAKKKLKDAAKKEVAIAKLELKKASLKKEAKEIALEIAKYKLQNWEKGQGKPEKPTAPIVGKKHKKEKKEKEKGEKATNKLDIVIENPIVETTEEVVVKVRKPYTKKADKTVEKVEETGGKTKKTRTPKAVKTTPPVGDHDDFTKIEGIGAKAATTLVENGIKTFAALAEQNPNELKKNLFTSRVYNLVKPSQHWIEQAKLAAAGDFEALEAMKKRLRGGK